MINHAEYTILIISDNQDVIGLIKKSFTDEVQSYLILVSKISGEAFDIIKEYKPDIILLDINYEDDTKGLDILFDLREIDISVQIPVIVISNDNKNIETAVMFGAADFLKVPFERLELTVRVKSILSLFKLIEGITGQARDLEQQSNELERQKNQLEIEKNKTDELLQNILPYEIAEQLKNKGAVKAKKYRMVSIMFTDFVGFTKISSELEPEEIIKELSVYFRKFDEITEDHFIEKIKTIGDAYMAVGGLPLRNKSNPIDVVLASLEIQKFMKEYNESRVAKGLTGWSLRLGIHTGKVVAGVIGSKKFAYDIWGDAVNTASRLESSGEAGKVNISGVTYEYIKDFFNCTYRGKISVKNKGDIDMYFVDGLKDKYREKDDSTMPNQKFQEELAKF
ncbi:MAG: response regulator [Bacteroidales bacterium]|nr:response regulator [Bacteroidales bacterium]